MFIPSNNALICLSKIIARPFWGLVLGCFLVAFVFIVSGCQSTPTSTQKIELKFSFWGSQQEVALIEKQINLFEKAHPDIDVIPMHIPDNYFQKIHILAAGNLMPDVVMVNSLYLPVYANSHKLLALDALVDATTQKQFFKNSVEAMRYKAKWYALPRDISNLVMFVNLDLLKQFKLERPQPNWTQQEFLTLAKTFRQKALKNNHPDVFSISFFEKPLYWLPFILSNGSPLFDRDFKKSFLDSEGSVKALSLYARLRNDLNVAPKAKQVGSKGMSELFVQGKLLFLFSGRWSVPFLREKATFNWDVLPFPKGSHGSVVTIDASGYAVSQDSQNQKQALKLALWLSRKESQQDLTQAGLIVPANQSLANSVIFNNPKQLPKSNQVFIDTIATGAPTHTCPGWDELSEVLNLGLEPVFSGRLKAEAVLPQLNKQLEKKLGEVCP